MTHFLRNGMMTALGLGILAAVWAKHRLKGYTKPNRVAANDEDRIGYVQDVVRSWLKYMPPEVTFRGRDVLELGPGSSIGTGALLLAHGARSYMAVDAFRLAGHEPGLYRAAIESLREQLAAEDVERSLALTAEPCDDFAYRTGSNFDIGALCGEKRFDLMLSCAAFEHFDDIERTIADLTKVARPGAACLHIVDFQTHSGWVRTRDPNNIYRFPGWLYRLFAFPGQPNRKRPADYARALEKNGWTDIRVIPAGVIEGDLVAPSLAGLAAPFNGPGQDMTITQAIIFARYS